MILDPNIRLEAVLAGAVSSDQPEYHVDYRYYNQQGQSTRPAVERGELSSATDVTLLSAPPQSFISEVFGIQILNKDTANVVLTLKTTDGSTDRFILTQTLAANESLIYTITEGFTII